MVPADKVAGGQFADVTGISKWAKALAVSIGEECCSSILHGLQELQALVFDPGEGSLL